ncbi:MAG: hypothetical protein LH613_09420 [Chamaesiphon sp.]|nr:hypothetical protein [Chamaesiphon sp.]
MQCLHPGNSYRHLPRKIRSKYTAQVHHRDRQPSNSDPNNLVALCTGCHLYYHQRQTGNITPGQLSLSLTIEHQCLTPPVFQQQLSLAIDLHHNDLSQASNVNTGVQLLLIKD